MFGMIDSRAEGPEKALESSYSDGITKAELRVMLIQMIYHRHQEKGTNRYPYTSLATINTFKSEAFEGEKLVLAQAGVL